MQLKRKPQSDIRKRLAVATSTLLGSVPFTHSLEAAPIEVEASQLHYAEEDRVTVNKTQITATKEIVEEETIKLDVILDTMSGASPNGRYIGVGDNSGSSGSSQIAITTASGFSFNASTSGEPLSNYKHWLTEFDERRVAGSLEWKRRWSRLINFTVGANASRESDYTAFGGSGKLEVDLNERRSTLVMAASVSSDEVSPEGGIPEGKGVFLCDDRFLVEQPTWVDCNTPLVRYKPGEKLVTDYLFGLTQVWNRQTLIQANYSQANAQGYLTDPYKLVSVVMEDDDTATEELDVVEIAALREKRPRVRNMSRFYMNIVHVRDSETIHASYRYFWDDWGVRAHTADLKFRVDFLKKHHAEPHFRFYTQNSADFYTDAILNTDTEPTFVSADQRLGKLTSISLGAKYGFRYSDDSEFGLRVEHMQQTYGASELPDMNVWIVQLIANASF